MIIVISCFILSNLPLFADVQIEWKEVLETGGSQSIEQTIGSKLATQRIEAAKELPIPAKRRIPFQLTPTKCITMRVTLIHLHSQSVKMTNSKIKKKFKQWRPLLSAIFVPLFSRVRLTCWNMSGTTKRKESFNAISVRHLSNKDLIGTYTKKLTLGKGHSNVIFVHM